MEVMGSNMAACLTVWQVYICQRAWDLVIEVCLQKAAEALLVSSILKKFNGSGALLVQDCFDVKVDTGSIEMKGKILRPEELAERFSLMEDLTEDERRPVVDPKFLDGPNTNIRVPNTVNISMAAKSKDEGGSEDEDDEDDDNEDDFGEEGEEDVSSEDGEDNNNDAGGGADEEDEDEEDEDDANNGNNGSGDDEDEDDDEEEVVEEEDDHGEGEEEEEDEDDEDEEDEEALHPSKKRKK